MLDAVFKMCRTSSTDGYHLCAEDATRENKKRREIEDKVMQIGGIIVSILIGIGIIGIAHDLKQRVPSISPKFPTFLNIIGAGVMIAPFVFSPLVHQGVEKLSSNIRKKIHEMCDA